MSRFPPTDDAVCSSTTEIHLIIIIIIQQPAKICIGILSRLVRHSPPVRPRHILMHHPFHAIPPHYIVRPQLFQPLPILHKDSIDIMDIEYRVGNTKR